MAYFEYVPHRPYGNRRLGSALGQIRPLEFDKVKIIILRHDMHDSDIFLLCQICIFFKWYGVVIILCCGTNVVLAEWVGNNVDDDVDHK